MSSRRSQITRNQKKVNTRRLRVVVESAALGMIVISLLCTAGFVLVQVYDNFNHR